MRLPTRPLYLFILLILPLVPLSVSASQKGSTLQEDFERMLQWFPGEYDNTAQVEAEKAAGKTELHEHIFHIFKPVSAPALGENVVFVKQYTDGDYDNVYRQRLYVLTADAETQSVKLVIYSFLDEEKYRLTDQKPELVEAITAEELRTVPGCEVYWTFENGHFVGRMIERACHFPSRRSGKTIYISDTLKLTDSEIWIADEAEDEDGNYVFGNKEGIPHKNIKSRSYTE